MTCLPLSLISNTTDSIALYQRGTFNRLQMTLDDTYAKIPPPPFFLSLRYGGIYPGIANCASGYEPSILVSLIIITCILSFCMISFISSNLFW